MRKQECNVFVIVDNPVISDIRCDWYSYHQIVEING